MGIAPQKKKSTVTLKDNSENITAWALTATKGQVASFNNIEITDNKPLFLDVATFKKLDLTEQTASWSTQDSLRIDNSNDQSAQITLVDSFSEVVSAGIFDGTNFAQELNGNPANNLVSKIKGFEVVHTLRDSADVTTYSNFLAKASELQ